ncbi:MAG: radical SAM family heme chaperone HemW [Clostridiales bacterium]|jgi:oxygen-independent coproporphyrinogen-3 oxidase|nr:radical SAM family heme chaperone HemW [Clostridiales bacterium]
MKTAGVYVHVPFCASKCNYCDFTSFAGAERSFEPYKAALLNEIRNFDCDLPTVGSVYIGGGTPTMLPAESLAAILNAVFERFSVDTDAEITVETNPGVSARFDVLLEAGANRLSVGAQAAQNDILKTLGRVHTREEIALCAESAQNAGFRNINADMMFSLPGQTERDILDTLEFLTNIGVTHVSAYSLTIEENTHFGRALDMRRTDDETDRAMYYAIRRYLAGEGYSQYEISNFAKPGFECRHNELYWRRGEYAGFGLNAHSFIRNARSSNTSDLRLYIESDGSAKAGWDLLSEREAMEEFMFLGLRLTRGVNAGDFYDEFGEGLFETFGEAVDKHVRNGLLITDGKNVALTEKGADVCNFVFVDFLA